MNNIFLDLVQTGATVIALIFTGVQVFLLVSEIRQNKEWNAQNAAFHYCISYIEVVANVDEKCMNVFLDRLAKATPNTPLDLENDQSKKAVKDLTIVLQYFERLSVGLLCNYFDEEVVRRIMNLNVIEAYIKYKPYIEYRRKITSRRVFSHFERVATTWIDVPLEYPFRTVPSAKKRGRSNF